MAAVVCPACRRPNPSGGNFCIFCGASVLGLHGGEAQSAQGQAPADDGQRAIQELQGELRRVREAMAILDSRLGTLERAQGMQPAPVPRDVAPSSPSVGVPDVPGPGQGGPVLESVPVLQEAPPPPEDPFERLLQAQWWEQFIGGNWLARIGVVAVLIGVGFFLNMAFENDWIGDTGRVVLGIIGGLVLLGAGEFWQRRYPIYAQALLGGGVALLYLSLFAAHSLYDLIGFSPDVALLALVSATAAALALRHDSRALAFIGVLGAFASPFLLEGFGPGTDVAAGDSYQLLVYLVLLDLAVLAIAIFRNWRGFVLLALIASLVSFGVWYEEFGDEVGLLTSLGNLSLMFLIFVGATTLFHAIWKRPPQTFDYLLMTINAAAYFGIGNGLLWDDYREWTGGFSLTLALFYGGVGYLALGRSAVNVRLSLFALAVALVFLTVALPIQISDRAWTTVAWAAEAAALAGLSFPLRMASLRYWSYAVFVIAMFSLVFLEADQYNAVWVQFQPAPRVVLNERVLAFVSVIAALYAAAFLFWVNREGLQEWERRAGAMLALLVGAANFVTLWMMSGEVIYYFQEDADPRNLSLTALWAVYAALALVAGFLVRSRPLRLGALSLFAVVIVKLFLIDVVTLERSYRVGAFIGLGTLLLAGGYLYQRFSKRIRGFLAGK